MSKRLAPYGDQDYAGTVSMIGTPPKSRFHPYGNANYAGSFAAVGLGPTKSPRLHGHGIIAAVGDPPKGRLLPYGEEDYAGPIAAVGGDDKSPRAEAPRLVRLVRLKAKAG